FVLALLSIATWLGPGAAQTAQNRAIVPLEATINHNAIMRQETVPPPTRERTLRGRLGEPIAGVPAEKLGETRITLRAVDFDGPNFHLDPSIFAPAWQGLIGKEITLHDLVAVLEAIEDIYRKKDYVV